MKNVCTSPLGHDWKFEYENETLYAWCSYCDAYLVGDQIMSREQFEQWLARGDWPALEEEPES